jgi:hypothetical protein
MDAILPLELTDAFPTGFAAVKPELKVLLVYQDFEMGVQGKQVFDLIAREAGNECAARLTVWRFDFFHSPQLTVAASQQAEEADVIIFAPRDPNWLPPQIKAWLERWPQRRKQHTGALIGVFHPAAGAQARSSDVALLLLRAASRAEMDFFFRAETPTGADVPRPTHPEPFTITRTGRPQYRNWGVNE